MIPCSCCGGSGVAPRGALVNELRSTAANLLSRRARLKELEKLARTTTPRHLREARLAVENARAAVPLVAADIERAEARLRELDAELALRDAQDERTY